MNGSDRTVGLPALLLRVDGVEASESMFSGSPALWVNGKEIAHADGPGCFDVRLTRGVIRELRERLRADPRVRLRRSSSSDWVEVEIHSVEDETFLVEVVERAAAAHRAPTGILPTPPPTGEALARRRRFH